MSLVPTRGVLAVVADLQERDPAAAAELVRLALYETLSDEVAKIDDQLQDAAWGYMLERTDRARVAFLRTEVGKSLEGSDEPVDEEIAGYLGALTTYVEKGLAGSLLAMFNRSHPRDDKGRFVTANTQDAVDAKRIVGNWQRAGLVDENGSVQVHYHDHATGERYAQTHEIATLTGEIGNHTAMNPGARVVGVGLDRRQIPNDNPRQRAAFDALATFAGPQAAAAGAPLVRGITRQDPIPSSAAGDWNRPSGPGDRQGYRRAQLAGRALSAVSAPGSAASTLGELAQLVGDLGPEAEKVLAPGIRRTAYRYRGTEKRPDAGLARQVSEMHHFAGRIAAADGEGQDALQRQLEALGGGGNRRGGADPSVKIAAYYAADRDAQSWSADQLELAMQGDAAAMHLVDARYLPDAKQTKLSIESGELPPSIGVIIDADGDVVSQAQGYNGDHYLPFDLKNLGDLHGGQYVRTRAAGGLTTEDIYTGLLTGARQVQVVSNSGVFTLELDPDLRGGRRYSDKARRMVERYGKMLDAIESGRIYERDIEQVEPGITQRLRRQAIDDVGTADADAVRERTAQLIEQERLARSVGEDEPNYRGQAQAEVLEYARHQQAAGRGLSSQQLRQQIADRTAELEEEARGNEVRQLQLDGQGYAAAMSTLQKEFPFYIRRATYQSLPDFYDKRGVTPPRPFSRFGRGQDRGRVETGQTNPRNAGGPGQYGGRKVPFGRDEQRPESVGDAGAVAAAGAAGAAAASIRPEATRPATGAAGRITPEDGPIAMPLADGTRPLSERGNLKPGDERHLASVFTGVARIIPKFATGDDRYFDPFDTESIAPGSDQSHEDGRALLYALLNSPKFSPAGSETTPEGKGQALARWFGTAPAHTRSVVLQGLRDLADNVSTELNEVSGNGPERGRIQQAFGGQSPEDFIEPALALGGVREVFNDPNPNDPGPLATHGTPVAGKALPFPDIIKLGDKVENYERYLHRAGDRGAPDLAVDIVEFKGMSVPEREAVVGERLDAYDAAEAKGDTAGMRAALKKVENGQRAHAYWVARKVAEGLSPDPKAPEAGVGKSLLHPSIAALLAHNGLL